MRAFNNDNRAAETFSPHLHAEDNAAAYWMRQVTLRLRREVCWRMHMPAAAADNLSESLGMQRYWEEKRTFFSTDPTAKYLTGLLQVPPPSPGRAAAHGSFGWIVEQLDLDDTSVFVLALALAAVFDSAVGSIVSSCLNDPAKTRPTLSLAQKLWDRPEQVLTLADPHHPLFRAGLLMVPFRESVSDPFIDWESPVSVPTLVANQLLFPGSPLPTALTPVYNVGDHAPDHRDTPSVGPRWVRAALHPETGHAFRIVPILGKSGAAHRETLRAVAHLSGRPVVECKSLPGLLDNPQYLKTLAAYCHLRGFDLYLGEDAAPLVLDAGNRENRPKQRDASYWLSLRSIPVTLFIRVIDRRSLESLPSQLLLPTVSVPGFSFRERAALWKELLGSGAKELGTAVNECARRFRYEKEIVRRIAEGLRALPGPLSPGDLIDACRAHLELDMGELAQPVTPRFEEERLILPHKQHLQFREVIHAMRSLTEVHYEWGTAKAWNESGISVLFAGPPGTGKTMAAEILALELDLPIFRIDLSQVVNKYIGETEKNLKRLFDAADISDMILFFDEADSLFGKRTEVKDAHDRYANLEISYLLERMERFKGLAILATNRKKDLDEAFLRRLRYMIDFPFPGVEQRKRIWEQVIPDTVDYSDVDVDFLAQRFQLTGGHIRSIVLNALLAAARRDLGNSSSIICPQGRARRVRAPRVKKWRK